MICKKCIHDNVCTIKHRGSEVCAMFEDKDLFVKLPCKVGDTVYTNFKFSGDYLKKKDAPYEARINFIGINDCNEIGYGLLNIEYVKTGRQFQFRFSDIGKEVFLTREEAEKAVKECEKGD